MKQNRSKSISAKKVLIKFPIQTKKHKQNKQSINIQPKSYFIEILSKQKHLEKHSSKTEQSSFNKLLRLFFKKEDLKHSSKYKNTNCTFTNFNFKCLQTINPYLNKKKLIMSKRKYKQNNFSELYKERYILDKNLNKINTLITSYKKLSKDKQFSRISDLEENFRLKTQNTQIEQINYDDYLRKKFYNTCVNKKSKHKHSNRRGEFQISPWQNNLQTRDSLQF